jgi:hypothetical protein
MLRTDILWGRGFECRPVLFVGEKSYHVSLCPRLAFIIRLIRPQCQINELGEHNNSMGHAYSKGFISI